MENKDLTALFHSQVKDFPLAHANFNALQHAVYREIPFHNFLIRVQYNPARIVSSNAKTDKETLQKRSCFLCRAHMPHEQQGIPFGKKYHIFINPYPIFQEHFTVPSNEHTPQLVEGRFLDLLNLAHTFPAYTIFYNGPDSGASAPDHFHFQIAPRHIMPLEKDCENKQLLEIITQHDDYSFAHLKNYLREVFILKSSERECLLQLFNRLQTAIGEATAYEQEPRFNLLAWYEAPLWTVCVFPRKSWRPRQFFLEGDEQIMFSPGCVDMAGLIIAPRKEDFERYTPELLTDLFNQVSITEEARNTVIRKIRKHIRL